MNQSAQAVAMAQKALDLARASGQTAEARQIEAWLAKNGADAAGSPQPAPPDARPATP
jgi:hypothetical protein